MSKPIIDTNNVNYEELMNNPNIALINDTIISKEELNSAFIKYLKLSRIDKRISDYYSVQLFGASVTNMYMNINNNLKASLPSLIGETALVSEADLYYNKEAFDKGDVNLCFVIGYSGSGKSVLTREYEGHGIEKVELDDIVCVKDHYTMEQLKEMGDLLYSFYNGEGAKYYISRSERDAFAKHSEVFVDFINYAKKYAEAHKDCKYILEGIWTYLFFDNPEDFDSYAVFMKGTSLAKSKIRRMKRELTHSACNTLNKILEFGIYATDSLLYDKNVDKWRHHFENKAETIQINEANTFTIINQNIMSQIYKINECFVNNNIEGIEEIMQSIEADTNISKPEKSIISEECKRAIQDIESSK